MIARSVSIFACQFVIKPVSSFDEFAERFLAASARAGKEQYLVPYFIASHPGSGVEEMIDLAVFLKARGYKPGRFSFNVKGGRCEACQGDGLIKIEMHFLPDIYVQCEECKGHRYNRETLEILYRGLSIADVLDLTVEAAT